MLSRKEVCHFDYIIGVSSCQFGNDDKKYRKLTGGASNVNKVSNRDISPPGETFSVSEFLHYQLYRKGIHSEILNRLPLCVVDIGKLPTIIKV